MDIILATEDAGFGIDVIVFVELLLVGLGKNDAVNLSIAEVLFVTTFGVTVSFGAVGCRVKPCFKRVC